VEKRGVVLDLRGQFLRTRESTLDFGVARIRRNRKRAAK
jgi:hypothetical protein